GRWAYGDADIHRTSVGGQGDADGYVAIDTFFAKDHQLTSYQLHVNLFGSGAKVTRLGAVASDPVNTNPYVSSATTMTKTVDLRVPSYSQEIHAGQYPQFDGGGEAWCSPTSTSMVVAYWGKGPAPADYAYVLSDYPDATDPWVDYAARYVFDYHYNGAGNWPFNTAYAAHFGLESEVTQLHSLAEAEQFVKTGIPLVASIAFEPNKLEGFLFRGTDGHLLVIGGFTASGDVISYDPAAVAPARYREVTPATHPDAYFGLGEEFDSTAYDFVGGHNGRYRAPIPGVTWLRDAEGLPATSSLDGGLWIHGNGDVRDGDYA